MVAAAVAAAVEVVTLAVVLGVVAGVLDVVPPDFESCNLTNQLKAANYTP